MASTRLPGKVLMDILGKPLLLRMVERVSKVKTKARIVVATTTEKIDNKIAKICRSEGIEVFRGHSTDLLDRHYQAASFYGADNIAKIPSDCPLIDPVIIDKVFGEFERTRCDYASNLHPASYPDGNDVEVMNSRCLKKTWELANTPMEREHTTPFIWDRPGRFKIKNVSCENDRSNSQNDYSMSHRWTIDYLEDYLLIQKIFESLYSNNSDFGWKDILRYLDTNLSVKKINEKYVGVNWYRNFLGELHSISVNQTKMI